MVEKKKKNAYHHGNLRPALINAGLEILSKDGISGLSIRKAARWAGVSHTAPYRHFQSKHDLIDAIAEEGFRMLTDALNGVLSKEYPTYFDRLAAAGTAYVTFARTYPSHLHVMFSKERKRIIPETLSERTPTNAFAPILEIIKKGQNQGFIRRDKSSYFLALTYWTVMHGLSGILNEEQLLGTTKTDAELAKQLMEVAFFGSGADGSESDIG